MAKPQKIWPMNSASPDLDGAHARRQVLHRGQVARRRGGLAQRHGAAIGRDRDVAAAVVARDLRRTGAEVHVGDVHQRHRPAARRHVQQLDLVDVRARGIVQPHADRDLPVRQVQLGEVVGDVAAGGDARRLADGRSRHAQFGCAVRPRPDDQLRLHQAGAGADTFENPGTARISRSTCARGRSQQVRVVARQLDLHRVRCLEIRSAALRGCARPEYRGPSAR